MIKNEKTNFLFNILLSGLLIIGIVWQLNSSNGYYHWFCNNLIKTNFQFLYSSDSDLTIDQKNTAKLGRTYDFLKLIKESTSEDAILLLPPAKVFEDKSNHVEFNGYMHRKGYVSYYLYPRQIIYDNEKNQNPLYNQISHVAIVNGWGYDKLNYEVTEKIPYSVLPINNSSINIQPPQ